MFNLKRENLYSVVLDLIIFKIIKLSNVAKYGEAMKNNGPSLSKQNFVHTRYLFYFLD